VSRAPAPETTGSALGLDVGDVRVGVAGSDPTRTIATPLAVLPRREQSFWERLKQVIAQRDVAMVVVGLPRALNGGEGDAAIAARRFAAEVTQHTGVPITFWDERLTTVAAERSMIAAGTRRRQRRRTIDSVAASLMLQSWLDAQRRGDVSG
jgi:putative Holliday junction resolvase